MTAKLFVTSAIALALQCPSLSAQTQTPAPQPGPFARMVLIQPHPGKTADFKEGYQRHLQWHRGVGDRWTWYGWNVVLGDRLGKFMDGTFFHAAGNFDHPVQPAADGADNAKNVEPHAKFESHGIYERLERFSAGAPLPDTSPYLAMTTYTIDPSQAQQFEAMLAAHGRARRETGERYSWYQLKLGGEDREYVLMRALPSFGAAAQVKDWFGAALPSDRAGVIKRVRSELLAFAPTLSYLPE